MLACATCIAAEASNVHGIMYLYLAVKFNWNAVTIGLFFSLVGLVVAVANGALLPCLVPSCISVRAAVPTGLFIHAVEYALYAFCSQGWGLVLILVLCAAGHLEPPSLHALISGQLPPLGARAP